MEVCTNALGYHQASWRDDGGCASTLHFLLKLIDLLDRSLVLLILCFFLFLLSIRQFYAKQKEMKDVKTVLESKVMGKYESE